MTDLFGEPEPIRIKGDTKLNFIARMIYDIHCRKPEIVKSGQSIGDLNRKFHWEVLLESGMLPVLRSGDIDKFKSFYLSKDYPTEEECARAFRELVKENHILLGRDIILQAEDYRKRIAGKMR